MRDKQGRFVKGHRASPSTEFQKGHHWRDVKPYWEKKWLEWQYADLGKSAKEIADEQGCGENNILFFLRKHQIRRRTMAQVRATKHWGAKGNANAMYGKTGAENPNWKGGVTPERQAFYCSHEWTSAVGIVWKRAKHRCQRCGRHSSPTGDFHIHHIVSFAVPELRCEPTNLALLCPPCHWWVHSKANIEGDFIEEVMPDDSKDIAG